MKFFDQLDAQGRLWLSLGAGATLFVLAPPWLHWQTRLMISWDAGVLVFLLMAWLVIFTATPAQTSLSTMNQDQSGVGILTGVVIAASVSLLTIGYLLHDSKNTFHTDLIGHIICSVIAVLCSWFLVHTMFTLHYAHRYYRDGSLKKSVVDDQAGGLDFPGTELPDYWDFAYFSFVVGMTSQVSDVQITSRSMRRLALTHGILSFFFNTTILALSINILASLLS